MGRKLAKVCHVCGREFGFFDTMCPLCNAKRQIFCGVCSTEMEPHRIFCQACGASHMDVLMPSFFCGIIIAILAIYFFTQNHGLIFDNFGNNNQNNHITHTKPYRQGYKQINRQLHTPTNIRANFETSSDAPKRIQKESTKNEGLYYEITSRSGGEEINIDEMISFSGMNFGEIIEYRKRAVKYSPVFQDLTNYEPSREVFDITDGLPWIGAYQVACVGVEGPNYEIGKGVSRESLTILNPELMLHPLIPSVGSDSRDACDESVFYVPKKVIYYKDINTITTYLDISAIKAKLGYIIYPYYLGTANARDLGYNAIYASEYSNVKFEDKENNFSQNISEPLGFWHRGYACGLPEGCNNYSPRDDRFDIRTRELPAAIRIKLWKREPLYSNKRADLTYEIVFE